MAAITLDLREIRQELGKALAMPETFAGFPEGFAVSVFDLQPTVVQLPAMFVRWPDEVNYDIALSGGAALELTVTAMFPASDPEEAQRAIDVLMSLPGVSGAIASYKTATREERLTLPWKSARVTGARYVRSEVLATDDEGRPTLTGIGFDFTLEVSVS